MGNDSV